MTSPTDITNALKDLLGETLQEMMDTEFNEHMGYEKHDQATAKDNYHNGSSSKKVKTSQGEIEIDVPRDRNATFEPVVIEKHQRDISDVDNKIINLYARGMSTKDGYKEILGIYIGENESAKFWLSVLTDLKNRGVKDILIVCSDGLSGIKQAIESSFPNAVQQRCIVHLIRNSCKYLSYKDRKEFCKDLKKVYGAINNQSALESLEGCKKKWGDKYPYAFKPWEDNWNEVCSMFNYVPELRKIMYTTNAIESLNSAFRKFTKIRTVFPSDDSLLKSLYLAQTKITEKWNIAYANWGVIYSSLQIIFEGRI